MTTMELRLSELRQELATGERALAELDQRREHLVSSMLRIAGAVQVLEELSESESEHQLEHQDPPVMEPVGVRDRG